MNIKFKTRQEVADEYGICAKTLKTRLKQLGVELPKSILLDPKTINEIYSKLGTPPFKK
jgi:hypothetical protein